MDSATALRQAVNLVNMPSRVRAMRSEPMPEGVGMLLAIAAGEEATTAEAAALTDRPPQMIQQAAAFYIEQILMTPEADSYRVLGASADASSTELRRNMALLLRWMHPDKDAHAERSMFAGRVTRAWEDLKTPDRRAAYDQSLRAVGASRAASHGSVLQRRKPRIVGAAGGASSLGVKHRSLGRDLPMHATIQDGETARKPAGLVIRAIRFLLGKSRN